MSRSTITSALLVSALALSLGSCSALDSLVGGVAGESTEETTAAVTEDTTVDTETTEEAPETAEVTPEKGPVPSCDTMYSDAQVIAFADEGRVSEGDISAEGYGYGTTDQELIGILSGLRSDLAISCTWYLPPEFSSTTSMAILSTEAMAEVEAILAEVAGSSTALSGGTLWTLDASSSNISGEFIANEAHFITETPCPSSLAETACSLWVASTNSAGSSEALTRDAATQFGALN